MDVFHVAEMGWSFEKVDQWGDKLLADCFQNVGIFLVEDSSSIKNREEITGGSGEQL